MSLVDEMHNLREDIESGKQIRKQRIQEIKEDLSSFTKNATQKRKEDFKVLTEEVKQFLTDLKTEVKVTQKEARVKQQEVKKMLADARTAFWEKKGEK